MSPLFCFHKIVLSHGLRVVVVPMKHTATVTTMVLVKTGSRYERKEENGISHLLEHLFFQGTKKRPSTMAVMRELDRIGAHHNAFTTHDHTAYYVKTDGKYLDLSLDVLSDMYINALFKSNDIEKERRVVVEEINMYRDTPQRAIWDYFYALLYTGNSLSRSVLGPIETVLSLGRAHFLAYRKKQYVAANTVVVVAGAVSVSQTLLKIKKYFADISVGDRSSFVPYQNIQKKPVFHLLYKKIDQAHVVIGGRAYAASDTKRYALEVLCALLGGYSSSRLFMSVRDRLGLAYYVGADTGYHEDTGYYAVYAGLSLQKATFGISTILKELHKIKTGIITTKEINDAKSHIVGSLSLHLESSSAIAMHAGGSEIITGAIETPEHYIQGIHKVSLKDIRDVARALFQDNNLHCTLIGPFQNKAIFEKILHIS